MGPQTQPNVVVVFGRGGATERVSRIAIRLRYGARYAVRDDEGDCNLHEQFCLRGGQRTEDYNPSVTSLRTGATSPCTGEAFSPRADHVTP